MSKIEIDLGEIKNSCFVVMPFSTMFQTEYEKIIQPALSELNIECIRGDEIYAKQRIVDDIWNSIKSCRFVLAELTGKNPNVLYEIGLAHAIGKPVIIITRNGDDVPFDLKALRYLFYDVNDPFWGENLKKGIQNLAQKTIENPEIEKYLEGISNIEIEFPNLEKKGKVKRKVKSLFNVSGTWIGEYIEEYKEYNEKYIHKVTLQLNQENDSLFGTAVSIFEKDGMQTVVQQMLNGSVNKNTIELHGVNYTFIERGKSKNYYLDSFILEYDSDNDILIGETISDVGKLVNKSPIKFKRI